MATGQGNKQTLSEDGDTDETQFIGSVRVVLSGTFGGGTAVLRAKDPLGVVTDVVNGSFTAVTDTIFDFPAGSVNVLTVNLSGATTPTLGVWLQGKELGQ